MSQPLGSRSSYRVLRITVITATLAALTAQGGFLIVAGSSVLLSPVDWLSLMAHLAAGVIILLIGLFFFRWHRQLRFGRRLTDLSIAIFTALLGGVLLDLTRNLVDFRAVPTGWQWLLVLGFGIWLPVGIGLFLKALTVGAWELQYAQDRAGALQAVLDFSEAVNVTDGEAVVDEVVRHSRVLTGADAVVLFLYDEGMGALRVVGHYHDPSIYPDEYVESMVTFPCPPGYGITGTAFITGEPILVENTAADARAKRLSSVVDEGPGTALVLPLRVRGRTIGVLRLIRRGSRQLNNQQVMAAKIFANQASGLLEAGKTYQRVLWSAVTDHLTGLPNRRAFQEALRGALETGVRFSLLMVDADTLKKVNDQLGHHAGDHLLIGLAGALQSETEGLGTAYRFGGDEFLVLLPGLSRSEAVQVAERIRHNRSRCLIESASGPIVPTVSIGVAEFPADGGSAAALLEAVDQAMYASKQGGRNQVRVNSALH